MATDEPTREPDREMSLQVMKAGAAVATLPCKVWLPEDPRDKVFLSFTSRQREHSGLRNPPYELAGSITTHDGKLRVQVKAEGVYFEGPATRYDASGEVISVSGSAHPDRAIVTHFLSTDTSSSQPQTHLWFDLTDNQLLAPFQSIETSYTGNRKVSTRRAPILKVPTVGSIKFMTHYYDAKGPELDSTLTRTKLVAETTTEKPANALVGDDLMRAVEPMLLLASFAARQRTIAVAWTAADKLHHVQYFVGDMVRPPKEHRNRSSHNVVVERKEFPRFLRRSLKIYLQRDPESRELLRQTIFKVLPDPDQTIESHFLTLFSALESLVLLFRREHNFEFVIPNAAHWKDLRDAIASVIDHHPALRTRARRAMLRDMVPALRRVPLRAAHSAYCKHFKVDMSDLWPAFGGQHSLNDIRNKLSHGDTFPHHQYEALLYAKRNLERAVERMLLALLRWPIERSNISEPAIASYDGITKARVDKHIAELAAHGKSA